MHRYDFHLKNTMSWKLILCSMPKIIDKNIVMYMSINQLAIQDGTTSHSGEIAKIIACVVSLMFGASVLLYML